MYTVLYYHNYGIFILHIISNCGIFCKRDDQYSRPIYNRNLSSIK